MREALRCILLFALVLRGLIPVGFMPVASAAGIVPGIVICHGNGADSAAIKESGKPATEKPTHEPCAFAGLSAVAAPVFYVTLAYQPIPREQHAQLQPTVVVPPVRAGPAVGSRAPPHRS